MTLAPMENRRVRAVSTQRYPLNKVCAHPSCAETTDDPHHGFRRSAIGGDSWFVEITFDELTLGETAVIPHVSGLCRPHHDEVTDQSAWIKLEDGVWNWYDRGDEPLPDQGIQYELLEWALVGPLSPQPGSVEQPPKTRSPGRRGEGEGGVSEAAPLTPRPKRTWAVAVPMDARENGHEIIETLMADAAGILGRQEHRSWKYYTMVEVLASFCRDYAGTDPTSGEGA